MRITSRVFKGTADDVINASKMVWFPPLAESIAISEDFVEMARRRKALRYAFFDMQTYLARTYQPELIGLRHWREEAKIPGASAETRMMEQFTRITLNALEQIANGIAYRFFDFNHTLVHTLNRQQTSPFNILSEGFWNSTEVAAVYNDHPVPERQVLISDLNSLTSIGDFVIKDEDSYEIVEVKSNKAASGQKISRQKAKAQEITDFLTGGKKVINGLEIEMVTVPGRKHHLHVLADLLEKADKDGIAITDANDYVSLGVMSVPHYSSDEHKGKMEELLKRIENGRDQSNLFTITSTYIRDKSRLTAPLPIFPLPSRHIVDILFGRKLVFFCLDLNIFEEKLNEAGWNTARTENMPNRAPIDHNVFLLWKGDSIKRNLGVPIDFLVSCSVELMDIDSYIRVLQILWDNGADGVKRHSICFYEDESKLWN